MAKQTFLKWTVEFEVSATWVEDGFDLTDERAKEWIEEDLGFATPGETRARVIKRPSKKAMKEAVSA